MKFTTATTLFGSLILSTGTQAQNICPSDIKTCPDSQTLNRDSTNNCEFPLCSGEKDCSSASTGSEENWLWCPSGTKTYRDGFKNCEFEQCDDPRCELEDYRQCPGPNLHIYVARDPNAGNSGCQDYLSCPGSGQSSNNCPQDIKTCPDGQTLNRDPSNSCEFPLCSGEKDCSSASTGSEENWLWCPSGTKTYRDGFKNCEFEQCDDPRCELEDYRQCPGPNLHVYVARDPNAGNSGCQDYLACPGSGTPEIMSTSESSGGGVVATVVGLVVSVAAAAGLSSM